MLRQLLSYLTFPGICVHEFAHAWACRRLGLQVHKVCYLRLGNPLGYVLHDQPQYAFQHILVAVAPFFVSTAVALVVSLLTCGATRSPFFPEVRDGVTLAGLWISFSIALHALPSSGDADSLWSDLGNSGFSWPARLMLVPVVGLIRLAQIGGRMWLDVIFALAIVALPPALLLVATS